MFARRLLVSVAAPRQTTVQVFFKLQKVQSRCIVLAGIQNADTVVMKARGIH